MPGCCSATSPPVSQCCVACGTRLCRAGTWLYRTTTSAPSTRCPRSNASRSFTRVMFGGRLRRACRARLPELFAQAGIGTRDGTDVAGRLERLADVRGPVYRRLQRGAFDRDAYGVSTERQAAAWDAAFAHDVERFPDRSRARGDCSSHLEAPARESAPTRRHVAHPGDPRGCAMPLPTCRRRVVQQDDDRHSGILAAVDLARARRYSQGANHRRGASMSDDDASRQRRDADDADV